MPFPLGAWIDAHEGLPHNLAQSGMRGTLATLPAALQRLEPPDAEALRSELARNLGVEPGRVFLTHGATEAATLVLVYLARTLARSSPHRLTFAVPRPEYPPLSAIAEWVGFRASSAPSRAEVAICSDPNNPTGRSSFRSDGFAAAADRAASVLVDETFREFTTLRSHARAGDPRVWTTGTFTKIYGADHVRVGYAVAPPRSVDRFAEYHGVTTDELPPASVAAARAILRDRDRILAEARQRLAVNLAALRAAVDSVPPLRAPLHFDRGPGTLEGDALGRAAVRAGVLVCPGSYFGDPSGVRLCLTRPSFPEDLAAYLAVRERWLGGRAARASRSTHRRAPGRSRGGR